MYNKCTQCRKGFYFSSSQLTPLNPVIPRYGFLFRTTVQHVKVYLQYKQLSSVYCRSEASFIHCSDTFLNLRIKNETVTTMKQMQQYTRMSSFFYMDVVREWENKNKTNKNYRYNILVLYMYFYWIFNYSSFTLSMAFNNLNCTHVGKLGRCSSSCHESFL